MDYVYLGKRVKSFRKKRKYTQEYLAEQVDLSIQHISNIENGRTKLSVDCLVKICNILDVSINELLADSLIQSEVIYYNEIAEAIKDCTAMELKIICKMIYSMKEAIREALK